MMYCSLLALQIFLTNPYRPCYSGWSIHYCFQSCEEGNCNLSGVLNGILNGVLNAVWMESLLSPLLCFSRVMRGNAITTSVHVLKGGLNAQSIIVLSRAMSYTATSKRP